MSGAPDIRMVPLAEVRVGSRARVVSPDAVEVLRLSYEEVGGFTTPIHVRKVKGGYMLIDGAHRLHLARDLGLDTIAARVWQLNADQARFFEVDANVAFAQLNPVAMARSLALRHKAYLKLHPETARGVAGGRARQGQQSANSHFADFIAATIGKTPNYINRIVKAGRDLSPEDAERLERAPRKVAMDDLIVLAKVAEPDERAFVVEELAKGELRSAQAARTAWRVRHNRQVTGVSPTDNAFRRLCDAWRRAPKVAKRRFLEEYGAAVAALLDAREPDA